MGFRTRCGKYGREEVVSWRFVIGCGEEKNDQRNGKRR